ncbi:MAG: DUF2157 domain-containing protein [Goleter apudmare HA4340-LM2]|jgi:hypothetical protein|nr:DUF2157 domain-containing protein [Goleter apudmare HA4340-LM2]
MLPEPPQKIEVRLPSSHPQLLEGLDALLRLGLISNIQVRVLCQEYLSCAVVLQPEPEIAIATANSDPVQQIPVAALASSSPRKAPAKTAEPNLIATMLQSLGAELSVRWLLFLGVFLVVVSSGVLAASQWERFPASGQYAVLLVYTLSFWGFSFWAARQNNLTLTAQTLLMVTLLLVPVNFWAMDSFQLWQNPLDWLTVAIATPILTVITDLIYKNRLFVTNFRSQKLLLVNILGLSYLHWGWKLPSFPLIAVYVAMVGTTIITVYHNRHRQINSAIPPETNDERRIGVGINLPAAVIVYALLVLLVRAIFVAQIDVTQLGLAVGICGWLMTWLAQKHFTPEAERADAPPSPHPPSPSSSVIWERVGSVLLVLGWLVCVIDYPGQAIAVSGLGLWYTSDRLRRYSLNADFAAVFIIGLQTIWLAWRLIPGGLQKSAIAVATQLTQAQNDPLALLSVALFPYIILMLVVTESFHRQQKRDLAKFGELMTLCLGAVLTTISLVNPVLRSLNLLFSTVTLAFITKQRFPEEIVTPTEPPPLFPSSSPPLVYLTHIIGVLTLCSTIDWFLPSLNNQAWAGILLVLMVGEWALSLRRGLWRDSAWYIGLGLAGMSFLLLWANAELSWYGNVRPQDNWGIIWLITPLALTGIASRTTTQRRKISTFLGVMAVGVAQLLTLPLPGIRLIGLAVAVGLMLANTRYLRYLASALITEGLILSFIGALLWEGVPRLSGAGWLITGAIATLSLWLSSRVLRRKGDELATIYAVASDKWAIALCIVELVMLTLHSLMVYNGLTSPGFLYLIATTITLGAIAYRSWGQPTNWAFYGIGWGVELLLAELLGFWGRSTVNMAIANIALGLITQLLGEWWRRKYQLTRLQSSLHILPLIYGAFSILLRFNTFTGWTGFFSLGVALIVIGVGRRREEFKPLLYLGIIGVSISAYELLFYQMSQATGGAYGDGLIAMSALGVGIMYAYRILSPWLVDYLRLTPQQMKAIAHIHWAWSSFLLLAAIGAPIAVNRLVGLGTGVFLIQYAIFEGRRSPNTTVPETFPLIFGRITIAEMWVYLGLLQVAAIRVYWRETAVGQFLFGPLMPWNGAIACVVAYFLYILPWENWGWSKRPWQHAAYIVPLVIVWETRLQIYPITLLIVAGFYIFLAKVAANIRFTYLSVALVDWALFRWFDSLQLTDALWYVTPIGLSILYIAQIDPQLKLADYKTTRHGLRLFGSGLICGWAILFHQDTALIPGVFSLIAIFAGLALRVRAFLYIGTAAFFITSIYQLVILSLRYPFLKWIIGLLVGILLISIAANFETRRAQITSLLRNTNNEFQEWQ